jgi:hypothetical protein
MLVLFAENLRVVLLVEKSPRTSENPYSLKAVKKIDTHGGSILQYIPIIMLR